MTLAQLISFFSARIIASYTPAEWIVVLEKIEKNRGRYGIGQWA